MPKFFFCKESACNSDKFSDNENAVINAATVSLNKDPKETLVIFKAIKTVKPKEMPVIVEDVV